MRIKDDPSTFQDYLKDASNYSGTAGRLYLPENESDVVSVCVESRNAAEPLTVSGARTGLAGAAVPGRGAIVSLEALTHMGEIETDGARARMRVGCGRLLSDIHRKAERSGWLYPPDPTEWNAALGGTLATNASGARYYKYGSTRDHIASIRVVLASGEAFTLRRGACRARPDGSFSIPVSEQRAIEGKLPTYAMPRVKHAAGYYVAPEMDMLDLFIGSEGTLGIITEAEIELIRPPERVVAGVAFFGEEPSSHAFVAEMIRLKHEPETEITIRALEYFNATSLDMLRRDFSHIPKDAQAAIWYELETTAAGESALTETWAGVLSENKAHDDSWFGPGKKDQNRFRSFRHALPVAVNERVTKNGFRKVATDFAVSQNALPKMMEIYDTLSRKNNLPYVVFGHIGDGHLHWNMLPEREKDFDRAWALYADAARAAIELGGTVSAEHGIGKVKTPYLEMLYGKEAIREMAALKLLFDPDGLLGRGTMFPESLLPPLAGD